MGRGRTITVHLGNGEIEFKKMIEELKKINTHGNQYYRRAESEIVKMMLEPVLRKEYERICRRSQ